MGKVTGFLEFERELPLKVDPITRIHSSKEFYLDFPEEKLNRQAARCMDCGVPFCHSGCPLGNVIPEFNDAVYRRQWKKASEILLSTNNFPEFTGRVCPAPCESACVLGINNDPVTIENIEKEIIEKAFLNGWVQARIPSVRTGKKAAVVGSGPAGLAAAAQLNQLGHHVTVFERDDRVGGLLRYGIPDFKLEKWVIDRRVQLMEKEGVQFRTGIEVGKDVSAEELQREFDAVALCGGSTVPRDLPIGGRDAGGVEFAMRFLKQHNRKVAGDIAGCTITAKDKRVIVIGGGDTGADCVGTSNRQGALSVMQLELMPKPPENRDHSTPWPQMPLILKTSTSHEEGCQREWCVLSKEFVKDEYGKLKALKIVDIEWIKNKESQRMEFREKEGTERELPCDLVLLAIGFAHPQKEGLLSALGISLDEQGNVRSENYRTNLPNVFTAGDMNRGQSLVVWAIAEGRECARAIHDYLS
ncbi:MAG: glutamate synthase subunit beta [Cytophagales bacterium]|nr:glutamate synthase subunit beta [Cytophagales bacterium]